MTGEERNKLLRDANVVSACCILCGQENPPGDEFSFEEFWVRDKRDWPAYTGSPVHRVCADRETILEQRHDRETQCQWNGEWQICYLMIVVDALFQHRRGTWIVMAGLN